MKVGPYMEKYTLNLTVVENKMNSDYLPAKIGKNVDKIRYWLSPTNFSPIFMKLTDCM